jgi:hypothetical protein
MSDTSKVTLGMSTAAAITSVLALLKNNAQAAQDGTIPDEMLQLLVAMAQTNDAIYQSLTGIKDSIDNLSLTGGQGWPPNANSARSTTVLCVAANTAYQCPDLIVPDGMSLAIKSSPANAVGSIVYVARTPAECTNPNSAWPLALNEAITYQITNAKLLWVSSPIAGSIAVITAEQRS